MTTGAEGQEPAGVVQLRPAVAVTRPIPADEVEPVDRAGETNPVGRAGEADPAQGASTGTGEPDDASLLQAHVAGDPDAFARLVHRHRDRLWAVAVRTLSDREEAADALQDALLSVHRAAPRFRGDAAVTTWLHRIVVNACLDRIRRRQAHPTVPLPDGSRPDESGRGGGVEPAAPATDHDTALVVRQALTKLPAEQRIALILVDVQGYPVAEVAAMLGVAEGTVKSRCSRGRARLAMLLGHLRPGRNLSPRSAGAVAQAGTAARAAGEPTPAGSSTATADPGASVPAPTRSEPDVRTVTQGNPTPGGNVRSASPHRGSDALQEEQ